MWPVTSLSDRRFSDRDGASSRSIGADTIPGHKTGRLGIAGGNAGGGHRFASLFSAGHFQVEREQLGQQVFLRRETVGGQNGGIEGRMSVLQRILARQFEGSVNRSQPPFTLESAPERIRRT